VARLELRPRRLCFDIAGTALVFGTLGLVACSQRSSRGVTAPPDVPSGDSTYFSYSSDPGDYVGQGLSQTFRYADGYWLVQVDSLHRYLSVAANGPNWEWNFQLALAGVAGAPLTPGSYVGSVGVTLGDRGCNGANANVGYTLYDVRYDSDTIVRYLHATFQQRCGLSTAGLRGEIVIVANPWR
jgi:hypothetical protein